METKIKKNSLFVTLFFIAFLTFFCNLTAQESKDRPIKIVKPVYLKQDEVQFNKSDNKPINKEYRLLKNSYVFRLDDNKDNIGFLERNNINSIENNIIGQYLYTSKNSSQLLGLKTLNDIGSEFKPKLIQNFRVILDIDNKVYFTDGSLFIFFNDKNINFSDFASVHNLMLKKEYIDLNMGVYVYDDFNSLENVIDQLDQIDTVSKVEYNVINPYIMPE